MSFENFFGEAEFNYEAEKQKFIDKNIANTGLSVHPPV